MKKEQIIIELEKFVNSVKEDYENGDLNILDSVLELKYIKEMINSTLADIKEFENSNLNEIALASQENNGNYHGFNFVQVNGRKTFSFKGIEEVEQATKQAKKLEEKYKLAYEGVIKGTTMVEEVDGVKMWVSPDGELLPLPELNIGASYLTIKQAK